jgi:hypothetical protein
MVNALEPRAIGARFDPLACPSLMVPSGGETDVKLGFIFRTFDLALFNGQIFMRIRYGFGHIVLAVIMDDGRTLIVVI